MQDAKEEVRARLNIEDVIGEYVQLKRAGRNFKGLSPFTSERTPSFTVSPEKHIWHDFSSGKGGDVFSFVMEVEGLDFRAALEQLARKAGVDLAQYDSRHDGELAKRKKRALEANELAARYFQQNLLKNPHALDYVLQKRRFTKEILSTFRIGYAPDTGDSLVRLLEQRGFTKKELSEAGLVNRFGGDLFRGRVMIPLMDAGGRVIGFTGRILEDDPKAPKYLNTPQTVIYDKSRHVFGLSQAKESIRRGDGAVVVEGNLDVVASHMAGVDQVVATAGTAMTEYHLKALSRLSHNVKLAFDADKAGLAATERALPIAQVVGVNLTIVSLPGEAKDPDELIQKDPNLWREAIDNSQPVVDWILDQYQQREDLTTAAGKRSFTSAALTVIRGLSDVVEQEHYQARVAQMTATSLDTIKQKQQVGGIDEVKQLKPVKAQKSESSVEQANHQDNLLAVSLIDAPVQDMFRHLKTDIFGGQAQRDVADYLAKNSGKVVSDTPKELQNHDTYVKILLLKAESRYGDWSDNDRYFEAARLLRQVTVEHKKDQKIVLTNELRSAEESGDEAEAHRLRGELNRLIKEISRGK